MPCVKYGAYWAFIDGEWGGGDGFGGRRERDIDFGDERECDVGFGECNIVLDEQRDERCVDNVCVEHLVEYELVNLVLDFLPHVFLCVCGSFSGSFASADVVLLTSLCRFDRDNHLHRNQLGRLEFDNGAGIGQRRARQERHEQRSFRQDVGHHWRCHWSASDSTLVVNSQRGLTICPWQGVAVVVVGCLLFWRLTQRRFSNLDHDVGEIKWPELQPDGGETNLSALNPPAARKTGGAGIEMEKDRELGYDTEEDEFGGAHGGRDWDAGSPRLGYGPNGSEQFYERGGGPRAQSPYELAYAGGGAGAYGGTYCASLQAPPLSRCSADDFLAADDPYLGTPGPSHLPPGVAASAADPFANPPTIGGSYPGGPSPTIVYPPPSHQHPSYPNPFASSADDVPLTAAQVPPAGTAPAGGIPYNARPDATSSGPRY